MNPNFTVIMAGGRGERFWPRSRRALPKHLLPIAGERPMIAQTVERLKGLVPPSHIFVLTNAEHVKAVRKACPRVPSGQIIGEPIGRDTAAAAAMAALLVGRRNPNGVLALLPADAAIHDDTAFRNILGAAFKTASQHDTIITLGVPPTHPATGYGYLRRGKKLGTTAGHPWFKVEKFVEKPPVDAAKRYLADGVYLWNAGMFVARAKVLEDAFRVHSPAIASGMDALAALLKHKVSLTIALGKIYPSLPKISVDYAVMEKASNVATFETTFDWDDVGEWPALARHEKADAAGNVVRADAVFHDARGNIVLGEPGHLIALLGVNDLVVVHTPDATLVCPKDRAQDLKKLLNDVAARPGGERWL